MKWQPFIEPGLDGKPTVLPPDMFDRDSTLLSRILSMPKFQKQIISFQAAWIMYCDAFREALFEMDNPEEAMEIDETDWIKWISQNGFVIILDGSEFEAV